MNLGKLVLVSLYDITTYTTNISPSTQDYTDMDAEIHTHSDKIKLHSETHI